MVKLKERVSPQIGRLRSEELRSIAKKPAAREERDIVYIHIFNVRQNGFGNFRYILLTFLIAFIFYLFNVFIANLTNIISVYNVLGLSDYIKFLFSLILDFRKIISLSSFIFILTISMLFGMFLSLIVFKTKAKIKVSKKDSFFGGLAIFLGIFAPGCAACGIGLVALLGLSAGFLSFLPYDGIEISIFSIIVLTFTIFKTSKDLTICDNCKIDLSMDNCVG